MEIELGRIYTTLGESVALPLLKYNDKVEAFILYAPDKASAYSPAYTVYDAFTGLTFGNDSSLDLFTPVYSLDIATGIMDKVISRGWSQSDGITVNAYYWDGKLNHFLELFRKVY